MMSKNPAPFLTVRRDGGRMLGGRLPMSDTPRPQLATD
jgi:hypothetical protein